MPLHYSRDGYTFSADPHSLTIEPGPNPLTLNRSELEQLGLSFKDQYSVPMNDSPEANLLIERLLSALEEAIRRCRGTEDAWMAQDLKRAMVLIGGLDEEVAQQILDQEGV